MRYCGQIDGEGVMIVHRRGFIAASGFAAASAFYRRAIAQTKKLRFGVGPLLPSPDDTKKAYAPVFAHLAKELGADFDLASTTDWAAAPTLSHAA